METYQKISSSKHFTPPDNWLRINTIDMHTAGEPLRVIVSGLPEIKGNSILKLRDDVREHYGSMKT